MFDESINKFSNMTRFPEFCKRVLFAPFLILSCGYSADHADAENFSWERYLEETSSLPAPARSFKAVREREGTHTHTHGSVPLYAVFYLRVSLQKPHHSFQVNMKLEAVDVRNPVMVRVATVVDRDEHRVKVHSGICSDTITPPTYDPSSAHTLLERGIQWKQKFVTVINPTTIHIPFKNDQYLPLPLYCRSFNKVLQDSNANLGNNTQYVITA